MRAVQWDVVRACLVLCAAACEALSVTACSEVGLGSFVLWVRFFKWGGIYSRFHPEAGTEVGKKWGVKLTKPNEKGA